MEKAGQTSSYTRNGGIIGSVSGGALAAILSGLSYGKSPRDKKNRESFAKRFIKSLLWAGVGAAGGGLVGAGAGRMIGSHVQYMRNLAEAKKYIEEHGIKKRPGRVLFLNYPDNVYHGSKGGIVSRIFPKGAPVQHGAIVTMDNDGGNAKIFQVGVLTGERNKKHGRLLIEKGLKENDSDLIAAGSRALSGEIYHGGLWSVALGNSLKGKTDKEIAKILADYGRSINSGRIVEVSEGRKNVDVNLPETFAKIDHRVENGACGSGYGIAPGGYNCGTASRRMYSTVNGPWDHLLDLLWGGFPSANAPSFSKKTVGRSYDVENRKDEAPKNLPGWKPIL